jgi:hypothetical protein
MPFFLSRLCVSVSYEGCYFTHKKQYVDKVYIRNAKVQSIFLFVFQKEIKNVFFFYF